MTPNITDQNGVDLVDRIHRWVIGALQISMGPGLFLAIYQRQWLNAMVIFGIIILMLMPTFLGKRFRVYIPPEFEILALVFLYASLFLGEVRGFYERIWWWDIALHTCSGLMLGIFGFLLVYLLNENKNAKIHMQPRFIAMFAFSFAVAGGALWEVFEFSMDQIFGANMQKPMFNDPSGLTDTMWDLIVDTLGAAAISLLGWWYLLRQRRSFIEHWIQKFIGKNPRFFKHTPEN